MFGFPSFTIAQAGQSLSGSFSERISWLNRAVYPSRSRAALHRSKRSWLRVARSLCWAISTRVQKAVGSISSAGRPRATRRCHCSHSRPGSASGHLRSSQRSSHAFRGGCHRGGRPADLGWPAGRGQATYGWYNQRMEEMIMLSPEQYWWVHRRWKGEPPARRKRANAKAA